MPEQDPLGGAGPVRRPVATSVKVCDVTPEEVAEENTYTTVICVEGQQSDDYQVSFGDSTTKYPFSWDTEKDGYSGTSSGLNTGETTSIQWYDSSGSAVGEKETGISVSSSCESCG